MAKKKQRIPQFEHCSMYGTYYIDCEILQENIFAGQYKIRYTDPYAEEVIEKWVASTYIKV